LLKSHEKELTKQDSLFLDAVSFIYIIKHGGPILNTKAAVNCGYDCD